MRQKWWVFISTVVAILSFSSLYYILNNLWPNPNTILAKPQLLLFAFVFLGFSASVVPLATYLNYRFAEPGWLERDQSRLARQGTWVGLLGVLLVYLQLIKALNWTMGVILMGVFTLIETFLLTRE